MKKFFLFFFLLLFFLFVFLSYKKNWWKDIHNSYFKSRASDNMLEFKNITLSGWNKGERQWEIKAKYVEVSKDRRTTIFHKIISGKFYKKNKEVFCFTAEKAVYDSLLSKLEIFGDIEIIGKENLKINTSHLLWDGNKKILEAKTNIFLISGNNTLIASSLVADQEMGILDLKNVFMNIEVEEIKKRVKI